MKKIEVGVIYEHPEWHYPLFEALDKCGISYLKIDLKKGAFNWDSIPDANIYYNMVSPSAYLRNNQKAIPLAFALCRFLEAKNKRVINGSASMSLEFSKSAQIALLRSNKIDHPQTFIFNDVESVAQHITFLNWPMILKPEQGGSGARMYLVNSIDELRGLLKDKPELWIPDNLLLLQEKISYDEEFGIVRLEFIEGKLLYAMRVVTHGVFNLCPSVVCNPEDGTDGTCEIIPQTNNKPEFYAYPNVPVDAVETGKRIMAHSGHNIGSVEYVETADGRRVFYDINANSNLRTSIGKIFGVDPFMEVAAYLKNSAQPNKIQDTMPSLY